MSETSRLDKWLWGTRFFKTRSMAQQAIRGGKVEINGGKAKPARQVRIGDRLRITRGELVFEVDVTGLTERRVSAPEAQAMYEETEAGRRAREERIEQRRAARRSEPVPDGRPDKRERRELRRFQRKR